MPCSSEHLNKADSFWQILSLIICVGKTFNSSSEGGTGAIGKVNV